MTVARCLCGALVPDLAQLDDDERTCPCGARLVLRLYAGGLLIFPPVTEWTIPVHDEPAELCRGCGQPIGSGTLLDFSPDPPRPRQGLESAAVMARAFEAGVWRDFAARYACPQCRALAGVARLVPGVEPYALPQAIMERP